jgi:hypothetical protein
MPSNHRFVMPRVLRTLLSTVLAASVVFGSVGTAAADDDEHYNAGVAAFAAGDYAKTITEMNASIDAHPNSKAALYLGNAYLKLGQLVPAKAALQRAVQLDPANPKRPTILKLIKAIEKLNAAKVTVTSTPPGATIYLGTVDPGALVGTTPHEVDLAPGPHDFIVVLEGYETEKRTQDFKAGEAITVDFPLRASGCDVALTAEPASARASIDGGEPLALPVTKRVLVGDHKVAFSAEGFEPKELPLTCERKPVALEAKLAPVVLVGRVKLRAPPTTVVAIDGRILSTQEVASGVALPVGRHVVTFTTGQSPPVTRIVDVPAGAEVPVEPPPPPPPPPRVGFPALGLYVGVAGGGNITLVEWNLGNDTHGAYPTSSAMAGVRVGLQVLPRLALEGGASWVGLPNRLDDGLGHGLSTEGNVLFHVLPGKWTPIVEAGAGTYEVLSSKLGKDADLRLHGGVGLRGALNDWFSLRADVRDVITDGFDKSIGNNLEVLLGVEAYLWQKKE